MSGQNPAYSPTRPPRTALTSAAGVNTGADQREPDPDDVHGDAPFSTAARAGTEQERNEPPQRYLGQRLAEPGEQCECGRQAVVAYESAVGGEVHAVPYCGIPDGGRGAR